MSRKKKGEETEQAKAARLLACKEVKRSAKAAWEATVHLAWEIHNWGVDPSFGNRDKRIGKAQRSYDKIKNLVRKLCPEMNEE